MNIALVGPPNVGKTTLFNHMTGQNADIGNRPGVTVDTLIGKSVFDRGVEITDLPGIYSLSSYTEDERAANQYIKNGGADKCICVLDAMNPERGIMLALRLSQFGIPLVLAVNMYDILKKRGGRVDLEKLSIQTGIPCIAVSSHTNYGIKELYFAAKSAKPPKIKIWEYPTEDIFIFAESIVKKCFDFGSGRGRLTLLLDNLLSNGPLSFFTFIFTVAFVFYLSFGTPGRALAHQFSMFLNGVLLGVKQLLSNAGASVFLSGLLADGFLTGLFSILSFLPQLAVLFFSLSLLEETGFLARAAMLSDSFFKRFGLSGRSAISFLLGFGCTVPAIMSARTIRSKRERFILISILPFISCGARLPVYFHFSSALFPGKELAIIAFLYVLGTISALTLARFAKRKDSSGPLFFIELPEYRLPDIKSVARLTWNRVSEFFSRSAGVLAIAFSFFWIMMTYNFNLSLAPEGSFGMLGAIGRGISVIFIPTGFGFWQACVALLCGFLAKESIIGVLAVITGTVGAGLSSALVQMFTPASAISFLVFVLLYTPCISTLKTMKHEYNSCRKVLLYTLRQLLIAYVVSVVVYNAYILISALF